MTVNWAVWRPRLLYGAFFALAFLLALRWTFPADAVKQRLIVWAASQGWQVDAAEVSPSGFLGIVANDVQAEGAAGQKLSADRIAASLRFWPLLVGRRSVAFDARIWSGRVRGTADLSGDRAVNARVDGVDLSSAAPLRRATGLELLGILGGAIDLALPADPAAKPAGTLDLTVKDAGVNGGQLQLPSLGGGLTIPKVSLGEVTARVSLAGGKGTVERLEAKGGDASLTTEGLYFMWQPRVQNSSLFGKARLRIEPAFWSRPTTAAFKGMAEMALGAARPGDGSYELQVFGTLGQPRIRPAAGAQPFPQGAQPFPPPAPPSAPGPQPFPPGVQAPPPGPPQFNTGVAPAAPAPPPFNAAVQPPSPGPGNRPVVSPDEE
jgi:type II secretion system protein N